MDTSKMHPAMLYAQYDDDGREMVSSIYFRMDPLYAGYTDKIERMINEHGGLAKWAALCNGMVYDGANSNMAHDTIRVTGNEHVEAIITVFELDVESKMMLRHMREGYKKESYDHAFLSSVLGFDGIFGRDYVFKRQVVTDKVSNDRYLISLNKKSLYNSN